jgi:hypothetical protein
LPTTFLWTLGLSITLNHKKNVDDSVQLLHFFPLTVPQFRNYLQTCLTLLVCAGPKSEPIAVLPLPWEAERKKISSEEASRLDSDERRLEVVSDNASDANLFCDILCEDKTMYDHAYVLLVVLFLVFWKIQVRSIDL